MTHGPVIKARHYAQSRLRGRRLCKSWWWRALRHHLCGKSPFAAFPQWRTSLQLAGNNRLYQRSRGSWRSTQRIFRRCTRSIAAPADIKLAEAWGQYNSVAGGFSVLAGHYDLNSEFYRLGSAGLFLNSSFGIGPAFAQIGLCGPPILHVTPIGTR